MNTRRYPRTLQEAFGPHTSTEFVEPPEGGTPWLAAAVALALVLLWVLL